MAGGAARPELFGGLVVATTGLRPGQLLGLQWTDVDLYGHLFLDRLDDLAARMDAAVCAPAVLRHSADDR